MVGGRCLSTDSAVPELKTLDFKCFFFVCITAISLINYNTYYSVSISILIKMLKDKLRP